MIAVTPLAAARRQAKTMLLALAQLVASVLALVYVASVQAAGS